MAGESTGTIREQEVSNMLSENYLPYALGTIKSRAIPAEDGLKPVHRRILYSMYKQHMTYDKDTVKCTKIVGQTMTLSPHGDSSVYDALVRMTEKAEYLNAPYIEGKGSFGKSYSSTTDAAHMRYTEAKLSEIATETMFDGLDYDAVDFMANFDNSDKEPTLLPTKYPTLLVNTSLGIAVSMSSNIAPFNLRDVCKATIAVAKGEITEPEDLIFTIGPPDFVTGGNIHCCREELLDLMKYGRGSVTMSGVYEVVQRGKTTNIVISALPYKVLIESVISDIRNNIKGEFKNDIADVKDASDINGMSLVIELKRDADVGAVIKKLCRLTGFCSRISFINRVLINGTPQLCGVYQMLQHWIAFRLETIRRINQCKLGKESERHHVLSAFEKIQADADTLYAELLKKTEDEAYTYLMEKYDFDRVQCDAILDIKLKHTLVDNVEKRIAQIRQCEADMQIYKELATNEDKRVEYMCAELEEIGRKYGQPRRTNIEAELTKEMYAKEKEVPIDDVREAYVVVLKDGVLRKFRTVADAESFCAEHASEVTFARATTNMERLIVFGYDGSVYLIQFSEFEYGATKGLDLAQRCDGAGNILGYDLYTAQNRDKTVCVLDAVGVLTIINYNRFAAGKRSKYLNVYRGATEGNNLWLSYEPSFFAITDARRACLLEYNPVVLAFMQRVRTKTRGFYVKPDEAIIGIQELHNVPLDNQNINLDRYRKRYTVKIGRDRLW